MRKLLALGASTIMRHLKTHPERATQWQRGILARRPVKVAVLAQVAKNARIAWAMLQSGACYQTLEGAAMLGAQSAQPIAASDRMTASNRPDTCLLQTPRPTRRKLLAHRGPSILSR